MVETSEQTRLECEAAFRNIVSEGTKPYKFIDVFNSEFPLWFLCFNHFREFITMNSVCLARVTFNSIIL